MEFHAGWSSSLTSVYHFPGIYDGNYDRTSVWMKVW